MLPCRLALHIDGLTQQRRAASRQGNLSSAVGRGGPPSILSRTKPSAMPAEMLPGFHFAILKECHRTCAGGVRFAACAGVTQKEKRSVQCRKRQMKHLPQ